LMPSGSLRREEDRALTKAASRFVEFQGDLD